MKQTLFSLLALTAMTSALAQPAPSSTSASNPFARPAANATPSARPGQGPLPPMPLPGQAGAPGMMPPPVHLPGYAGQDPSSSLLSGPEPQEQEVVVTRIGVVNGEVLYRGTGTYLFEKDSKRPLLRKPVTRGSDTAVTNSTPAVPGVSVNAPLPAAVGRPAQSN